MLLHRHKNTIIWLTRRHFATLLATAMLSFLAHAEPYAANPICSQNGPSFYAEKQGRVVVLLGTLHQGNTRVADTTRKFSNRWLDSINRVLYTESGIEPGHIKPALIERYKNGPRAIDDFAAHPSEKAKWIELFGEKFVRAGRMNMFFEFSNTLSYLRYHPGEALKLEFGSESVLYDKALKTGIPVRAIESTEAATVIESYSSEQIYQYVQALVSRYQLIKRGELPLDAPGNVLQSEVIDRWVSGDVDTVANDREQRETAIIDGKAELLNYMLNVQRNRLMAGKIDDFIAQAPPNPIPIVAVGVAHLGGREGILNLLRLRGYTIGCG